MRAAIEDHIDQDRWGRLKEVERLEQQTVVDLVGRWQGVETEPRFGSDAEGAP